MTGFQGCGGVTPIGPLETLHNALSLRQLDIFLDKMTNVVYRTPLSSPPKMPSTPTQGRAAKALLVPLTIISPTSSELKYRK